METTTTTLPAATTRDLSNQYGCPATMTAITFIACGIVHRARRLWRSDMPTSGKIELYTLCPYNPSSMASDAWHLESAFSEDWFRYVDEFQPSRVDAAAMVAMAAADASFQIQSLAMASVQRFAAMELV